MLIKTLPLLLLLAVISSCSLVSAETLPLLPTATTVRAVVTSVPTVARDFQQVGPAPGSTTTERGCADTGGYSHVRHFVEANVNYAERTAAISQRIEYTNHTNTALEQIVLNIEANRLSDVFRLQTVHLEGQDTSYELTGRRLTLELPTALDPGCVATIDLGFELQIPRVGEGLAGLTGYLGYSVRQINLGGWLATVAVRSGGEWITREAVQIGEQSLLEEADWDITFHVTGAAPTLRIAAPGEFDQLSPMSWQFEHMNARDFSASMSETFNVSEHQSPGGATIELYSFNDALVQAEDGTPVDGATYALDIAARAFTMYEDLFGAYPYPRLVIVQGDFPDGMEFSGLVFVSSDWFRTFVGTPESYLLVITVHEISHQWWYGLVGSDQAEYPWLDEALATYSEYVFIEETYPELKDWWWEFRVTRYAPGGFVDGTVYEFGSVREYINAIYLRGATMLHDLRRDLGNDMFFNWLRRYADAGRGRIMTPETFWSLLSPEELALTQGTRYAYLQMPEITPASGG